MCVETVQGKVETSWCIAQATTCPQDMEVVFLRHLRLCAMIACGQDGGGCGIFVEGGIGRTVGGEGRLLQVTSHIDSRSSPKQGPLRTGGVGTKGLGGSS